MSPPSTAGASPAQPSTAAPRARGRPARRPRRATCAWRLATQVPSAQAHGVDDPALGPPAQPGPAVLGDAPGRGRGWRWRPRRWTSRGPGRRTATARRSGRSSLRLVSAVRALAPAAAPRTGGHHGGTSWSSATSQLPAGQRRGERAEQPARPVGHGAAVEEVPGQDAHRAPYASPPPCPAHLLTGAELDRPELERLLARAAELKAAPARLARARGPRRRAASSSGPRPAPGSPSRPGSSSSAATRWCCAPARCSSRAASRSGTPRASSRVTSPPSACAPVPTRSLEELAAHASIPVFNMLTAGPPPLPGAGRPADPARALRRAWRACGSPTSATATTSRARWRSSARPPASRSSSPSPAGYELEAEAGARARRRPGRGGRRRPRGLHRRLGLDGRRGHRRRAAARPSPPTGSTTRCSTAPRPAPSRCTACRPTPARRSPPPSSTATREAIWDQAENRRHAQKALLEWLVAGLAAPDGAH